MTIDSNKSAGIVGVVLLSGFTALLCTSQINQTTYAIVAPISMLLSLTIACLPRLSELDLSKLRLVLREIKETEAEIKKTKADIEAMYGGIEKLKVNRRGFDYKTVGPGNTLAAAGSIRNYVAGCITRERERLAKIFVLEKAPEKLAEALLDTRYDREVFQWSGMGTSIEAAIPDERAGNEPPRDQHEQSQQ